MSSSVNSIVQSHQKEASILGVATSFVLTKFSNCNLLLISQLGKIGNIVKISLENPVDVNFHKRTPIYNSKIVLGADEVHVHVIAQAIAKACSLDKPLILGFAFVERDTSKLLGVIDAVVAFLEESKFAQ